MKTVLLSLASGLFGAFLFSYFRPEQPPLVPEPNQPLARQVSQRYAASPVNADFVAASAASTPSVVFIKTTSTVADQYDIFDWFFGGGGGAQINGGDEFHGHDGGDRDHICLLAHTGELPAIKLIHF